jgi:hypothetical protein
MGAAAIMGTAQVDSAEGTVLEGVTIENVQDRMRNIGIRPGQRVVLKVVDPGVELLRIADRVGERALRLGLTEEGVERLLEE